MLPARSRGAPGAGIPEKAPALSHLASSFNCIFEEFGSRDALGTPSIDANFPGTWEQGRGLAARLPRKSRSSDPNRGGPLHSNLGVGGNS